MFIETVSTPNPNTLKFIPGCEVLPGETREYKNQLEAEESPLAVKIFSINGVSGVFFSNHFITLMLLLRANYLGEVDFVKNSLG